MKRNGVWVLCAAMAGWLGVTGCESDEISDHNPPEGQGSLIVDNQSPYRLDVYLNGQKQESVGDFDDHAYDRLPGVYRLVLDPDEDFLNAVAGDVDVLEGRRTVVQVSTRGPGSSDLDLSIRLD